MPTDADTARFWEKVDRSGGPEACWPWTAATARNGYGTIRWTDFKMAVASRVSMELDGRPPGKAHVLHSCDNPPCVNPAHLRLGDRSDNAHDAYSRGRMPTGEAHKLARLTRAAVDAARTQYRDGGGPVSKLAAQNGVSYTVMRAALTGATWKRGQAVEPVTPRSKRTRYDES
jgi:hypothetical protein